MVRLGHSRHKDDKGQIAIETLEKIDKARSMFGEILDDEVFDIMAEYLKKIEILQKPIK